MIAYLHKAPPRLVETGVRYVLTLCARPCNGEEFQNGEHIAVSGKREARAICAARKITPWNF